MVKLVDVSRPDATSVMPSDYVWADMDPEVAHAVLGHLLNVLYEKCILSAGEIVEIISHPNLEAVSDYERSHRHRERSKPDHHGQERTDG